MNFMVGVRFGLGLDALRFEMVMHQFELDAGWSECGFGLVGMVEHRKNQMAGKYIAQNEMEEGSGEYPGSEFPNLCSRLHIHPYRLSTSVPNTLTEVKSSHGNGNDGDGDRAAGSTGRAFAAASMGLVKQQI